MKNKTQFNGMTILRIVFFLSVFVGSLAGPDNAGAGAPARENVPAVDTLAQLSKVTVTLRGADQQGVVQIFDYLLGRFPGVMIKQTGELHIIPENTTQCVATWQLTVQGTNGLNIESGLISTINSLDLASHNDIFYEAPFIIVKQDLERVKQIKGRKASEYDAVFSLLEEDFEPFAVVNQNFIPPSGNPWLSVPGAGFE